MADFMEFYSNDANTPFDQAVIYQHHPHHPIDIYFEKKSDFPSLPCILMDDNPSFSVNPIVDTSTTTTTSITTAKSYSSNSNNKRKQQHDMSSTLSSSSSSTSSTSPKKKRLESDHYATTSNMATTPLPSSTQGNHIIQLQDTLDYLQDEWATIDIVLQSLKTAFTIHPSKMTTEEYLDEIDRELSIAYDDLMAQVRSLDRNLKRLDTKIKSCHTDEPLA